MKKLLSLLTISTLTASIPAPLMAMKSSDDEWEIINKDDIPAPNRTKRNVSMLTSNSNNDYVSIKKITSIGNNVIAVGVDSKDNIYFGTTTGAFVLKNGETTPEPIKGIIGFTGSILVDINDNVYIGASHSAYKLSAGSDTPTKINGINESISSIVVNYITGVVYIASNFNIFYIKSGETTANKLNFNFIKQINSISINNNNDLFISTKNGAYKLSAGSDTPTKINGINGNIRTIVITNKNDIYFSIDNSLFVLKQGETTPAKINGINDYIISVSLTLNNNIYFGTTTGAYIMQTALSWVKTQSQFSLVDSSKTQTWTRNDLIAVDGEVNIDIANPNIDKVVFDNVEQPQTSKQWKINVKPETVPRDHNLQVMFTLDGKQYTSEITVSMQAKIDSPIPSKQENLSDVIKFSDENNLGNIVDNNDSTIFSAITQKNARIVDFSQITIEKKDNNSATLTAKPDSKSYKGSVAVKYNVVPATTVDLKIELKPTAPNTTVVKDYLGQIDISSITNPVNTFYYASSESVITMVKPTASSVITGVVYGCDDKWNKTSQSDTIDPTSGIKLDASQLATKNGKYIVELSDNLGYKNNIYLQIAPQQKISNYFDTDNGKQFEIWAKANRHDNIRGYSASQLNKLFAESKNWQQIASDNQFATALADWFKTNGKLLSKEPLTAEQVVAQLKTQIPNSIKIPAVNTSNYDVNKVSFQLNQTEFNPKDKVNITVKYNNATSKQFTLQIKDSKAPNKKGGLTGLAIVGIVVGSLAGLVLLGWLLWKFVVDPFILGPIREKKQKAWRIREDKALAEIEAEEEAEKEKRGK